MFSVFWYDIIVCKDKDIQVIIKKPFRDYFVCLTVVS